MIIALLSAPVQCADYGRAGSKPVALAKAWKLDKNGLRPFDGHMRTPGVANPTMGRSLKPNSKVEYRCLNRTSRRWPIRMYLLLRGLPTSVSSPWQRTGDSIMRQCADGPYNHAGFTRSSRRSR